MAWWNAVLAIVGFIAALIGLYHWLRLERNEDAAYRAGNAVMYTIIAYQLMENAQ